MNPIKIYIWALIIVAVAVAVLGNSVSSVWASQENRINIWLIPLLVVSPLVFLTFGMVTAKLGGLAVTSATIDILLTVCTVAVGLIVFNEWSSVSTQQYIGIFFALLGVILIHWE